VVRVDHQIRASMNDLPEWKSACLSGRRFSWPEMVRLFSSRTFRRGRKKYRVIDVNFNGDVITKGTRNAGFHQGRFNGRVIDQQEWFAWCSKAEEVL
jgi:hypothetical protein